MSARARGPRAPCLRPRPARRPSWKKTPATQSVARKSGKYSLQFTLRQGRGREGAGRPRLARPHPAPPRRPSLGSVDALERGRAGGERRRHAEGPARRDHLQGEVGWGRRRRGLGRAAGRPSRLRAPPLVLPHAASSSSTRNSSQRPLEAPSRRYLQPTPVCPQCSTGRAGCSPRLLVSVGGGGCQLQGHLPWAEDFPSESFDLQNTGKWPATPL